MSRGQGVRTSRTPVEALDPLVRVLVRARLEAGLTQQEVADEVGLSRATIGSMEVGQIVGSLTTLDAVAGVYGWHVGLVDERGREVAR